MTWFNELKGLNRHVLNGYTDVPLLIIELFVSYRRTDQTYRIKFVKKNKYHYLKIPTQFWSNIYWLIHELILDPNLAIPKAL